MDELLKLKIREKARTENEIKSEIIISEEEKKKYKFPISAAQRKKLEERKWILVKDLFEILKDFAVVHKEELQVWCKICNKWIITSWQDKLWHVKYHKAYIIIPRKELSLRT